MSGACGTVGVVAGEPPPVGAGVIGARAICDPPPVAAGAAGTVSASTVRIGPVRGDAPSVSGFGGGAGSCFAGVVKEGVIVASARTASSAPIPGCVVSSAAVSVAAGRGAPKIHTASAHSTKLRMRTRMPESRVMALSFVAGLANGEHDSPIGERCTGMRHPCRSSLRVRKRSRTPCGSGHPGELALTYSPSL